MREGGCPPQRAWLFFSHGSAGQGFSRYPFPPPLVDRHFCRHPSPLLSQDGSTPLLAAVKGSHDTIVKLLLAGGADVNAATTVGPVGCGMPAAPCACDVPSPPPHTHAHTHTHPVLSGCTGGCHFPVQRMLPRGHGHRESLAGSAGSEARPRAAGRVLLWCCCVACMCLHAPLADRRLLFGPLC
jgi:hypothetical protein